MRIAVEEYELYNNGILACEWFDLEDDTMEEIEEYFTELKAEHDLGCDLELFVADIDDEMGLYKHLGESHPIDYYKVYEDIKDLDKQELKKLAFLVDYQNYNITAALHKLDDCCMYEDMDFEDLARLFIDEGLYGEIPDNIRYYLDIELMARDLSCDYTEYDGDIFRCD